MGRKLTSKTEIYSAKYSEHLQILPPLAPVVLHIQLKQSVLKVKLNPMATVACRMIWL